MTTAYYANPTRQRRKAEGLCVRCGMHLVVPPHATCARCRGIERQRAQDAQPPEGTPLAAPHIPGPAIACCGQWHPVTALPFIAPCGSIHLAEGTSHVA